MVSKQTTLDLNGPILSFTRQPQSVSVCDNGSATFIGIATATFPTQTPSNPASNTGTLSYRWYAEGVGVLNDGSFRGATIAGTATTTLTLSNAKSPETSGSRFYLTVDYVSSAYVQPVGSEVNVGTARSTGNAVNEVLNSSTATLTVFPTISVVQNPSDQTVATGNPATFSALGSSTDNSAVSYRWQLNNTDLSDGSRISGSSTPNLSISSADPLEATVRARISHPTSCNSPIFTNTANFTVLVPREIVNYEVVSDTGSTLIQSGSQDVLLGSLTFDAFSDAINTNIILYAPERDTRVRITLAGSAGGDNRDYFGGSGGVSTFELTLEKNIEYVVKLGNDRSSNAGSFSNGGGGSFIYRQSRMIAACGGGGGVGGNAPGGDGGGIGVNGATGRGSDGGAGGRGGPVYAGDFPAYSNEIAEFPVDWGYAASDCTVGSDYWRRRFSYCQIIGFNRYRNVDGFQIPSTTNTIQRGYKPGLAYRQNGGSRGDLRSGWGGGGASGGDGAFNRSGGGGGSGWQNGSLKVLSTQLGGNPNTRGYIRITTAR
jgi:hypothetical protein